MEFDGVGCHHRGGERAPLGCRQFLFDASLTAIGARLILLEKNR